MSIAEALLLAASILLPFQAAALAMEFSHLTFEQHVFGEPSFQTLAQVVLRLVRKLVEQEVKRTIDLHDRSAFR